MVKIKKILKSPVTTVLMFALAAVMLLFSTIGGTRAALTYYSENYSSRVQMYDIGVTLVENDREIAHRNYSSKGDGTWEEGGGVLLENMLAEGESFQLGKNYEEVLKVKNSGTIDQYVRVSIYKYWLDANGNKMRELSPDLIELNLINEDKWLLDQSAATQERTVLYYSGILGSGETTAPLSDRLTVDGLVASKVTTETKTTDDGRTTITTTYDYNGVQFRIEATVDAVQTHNAEDAILSAWGRKVSVGGNGSLSLK